LAPTAVDFDGAITVDRADPPKTVAVGETVEVESTVHNISEHAIWASSTLVPTALATVCDTEAGARTLWWMTNILLEPGASSGRGGYFTPTEDYVGMVTCEVVVVTSAGVGDEFDTGAGGDEARTTIIGPVVGVPSVTFTVVASTATTAPEATTTTTGP
jgi:hypothetical protein